MTKPDTTTVRAWARNNGFTTGDRGRLPAAVLDAYDKAHAGAKKASTGSSTTGPAKKATGNKRTAAKAAAAKSTPAQAVGPDRMAALERKLAELASRLDVVESAAGQPGSKASSAAVKPARKSTRQR